MAPDASTLGRDDRQKHACLVFRTDMKRYLATEHRGWAVRLVVVNEGAATLHRVFQDGECGRLTFVFIILAAQGDARCGIPSARRCRSARFRYRAP